VKLKSSANVQSEVMSNSLSVDEEAYFDGTLNRVEDPVKDRKRESK
jgi:cytoskeletal protein CcmA (bactofilin family)